MKFESVVNSPRFAKTVDPAIYDFLIFLLDYNKKARTIFSCEGHRDSEPAWVSFEVLDRLWFNKISENLPKHCKVQDDRLYIYHKNKYPDLYCKLKELKGVIESA